MGTEVVRATWDAHAQHYTVLLEDLTSKAHRTVSAKVVLSATGGFQQPRIPEDLVGLETFLGDKWHSASWRHDVSLAGKRVGVIGNGCSAYVLLSGFLYLRAAHTYVYTRTSARTLSLCVRIGDRVEQRCDLVVLSAQFVPQISADSSVEVINFCRTPQWYTERVSLKLDIIKIVARAAEQVLSSVFSDSVRLSRVG